MNGVTTTRLQAGLPATTVLRLAGDRPRPARRTGTAEADEVLLAAVAHPPRVGEARPIAALMPQVLARYGLAEATNSEIPSPPADEPALLDVLA
jgi:hypothetical protein